MAGTHGGLAQVGRFGVVGVLNTLIDFTIFNVLTSRFVRFPKIAANICSTTVAMLFSFVANRQEVFNGGSSNPAVQIPLFFLITGFGVYGLQNLVLYFLLYRWRWPTQLGTRVLKRLGIKKHFELDLDVLLRNGAKISATLVSLTWNFFMYKFVVFR